MSLFSRFRRVAWRGGLLPLALLVAATSLPGGTAVMKARVVALELPRFATIDPEGQRAAMVLIQIL